uniref:Cell cycle checkpoint protein RAD17 n=1 Tax=Kalanchoe fedtschenkoi TaxID=63787 RepID=A0A7N0ZT17_KALFE
MKTRENHHRSNLLAGSPSSHSDKSPPLVGSYTFRFYSSSYFHFDFELKSVQLCCSRFFFPLYFSGRDVKGLVMGERNTIVVWSSSEDDKEDSTWSSRGKRSAHSNLKSSKRSTSSKGAKKKARVVGLKSRTDSSDFDQVTLFSEDFHEGFNGFKVPAGSARNAHKQLWVDKYKPRSLDDLAVHKKKVEEVKMWFQERLRPCKDVCLSQVLIVTGQTGIGKSSTIHMVASHFGAKVCEWTTPTPTLWQEHMHMSSSGMRYTSKLDEFENFVERMRKYGSISFIEGQSNSLVILMIDDLPVANGKPASGRLQNSLRLLVQSASIPTVIVLTDYGRADSPDGCGHWLEELQSSLESAGACKYFSLKLNSVCYPSSISNHTSAFEKGIPDVGNNMCVMPMGRDETLSLFHALGKFLHNKREAGAALTSDQDAFVLNEKFARLPLKMDAPEKILWQAHGQARPITEFLHENVLDFLNDEAIDDSWTVAAYLSDADTLLASRNGVLFRNHEAENLGQSVAASVASRGVLFGNSCPVSSRWHSIRRPKLWQVELSSSRNMYDLLKRRLDKREACSLSSSTVIATEYMPAQKWLNYAESTTPWTTMQAKESGEDECDAMSIDGDDRVESEDEIEDW